jgi:hypothetical protein
MVQKLRTTPQPLDVVVNKDEFKPVSIGNMATSSYERGASARESGPPFALNLIV